MERPQLSKVSFGVAALEGCAAKIDRARELVYLLQTEVSAAINPQTHRLVGELDIENACYLFRVEERLPVPPRLGVILGEVSHNLRSSLDHLMWQIVDAIGNEKPGRHTQFPIYTHRKEYRRDVLERSPNRPPGPAHGIPEESREWAMLRDLQPYRAGEHREAHELAVVRWLSNTDKHQVVHAVRSTPRVPEGSEIPRVDSWECVIEDMVLCNVPVEDGAVVARANLMPPVHPNARVTMDRALPSEVTFGERGFRAKYLPAVVDYIARVIGRFAFQTFKTKQVRL